MNKQSERQARYDKKHIQGIYMKLHKENDKDILGWLDNQESKQGAIKIAIREMIKAGK